ncbi:hypothetical protein BO83DRAFT_381964 [Aspergillus eucalypticola CBS 122712]|uniref:Arrestin-like N-terminal domain-containing protein n=1 Tax=Aspergillus eucalypticola (strain CBS 122712 / IBT 29274) TaxID=1448314 RepID=A0A317USU8_ASPEC|nr:uncharacterized protein BO83DRAFT_381964 [Aspergillus eucalypticola CBS 122712]PWY64366.1 hypothetical protein BO83DRAFT_381964 [Aspergillus eucalypticola CBS 122712]
MAPRIHIQFNQQTRRNCTSSDYAEVLSANSSHVITDGHLDGNVIVSMPGNETASPSQQLLVEVTFEGHLSTAVNLNVSTQLLRLAKNITLLRASDVRELAQQHTTDTARTILHPFHFNIPRTANSVSSDEYDTTPLPPSLSFKPMPVYNSNDLILRGQGRIEYFLKARLFDYEECIAETEAPVTFAPARECAPPICIPDFPGEYNLASSRSVRDRLHRRELYYLSVQTGEPAPLYLMNSGMVSTVVPLKWHYRCLNPSQQHANIPGIYASIQTSLRATTFVSVSPQDRLPLEGDANKLLDFKLVANTTGTGCTQVRKLRIASWEDCGLNKQDQPTTYQATTPLILNFDAPDYLPPTFTHPYISRRYSLSVFVSVDVDNSRNASLRLRVPVQVSYDRGERATECMDEPFPLYPEILPPYIK